MAREADKDSDNSSLTKASVFFGMEISCVGMRGGGCTQEAQISRRIAKRRFRQPIVCAGVLARGQPEVNFRSSALNAAAIDCQQEFARGKQRWQDLMLDAIEVA